MFSQNPRRAAATFPISRSDPLAAPPLRGDSENLAPASLISSVQVEPARTHRRSGSRPESAPFDKLREKKAQGALQDLTPNRRPRPSG